MIGTWNVAGQTPNEDVDLDQWLCTQEPADMYVLGWVPSQAMKMDLFT
jgi:type I inositol polyphosphate 5-phosphatase IP5P1/2